MIPPLRSDDTQVKHVPVCPKDELVHMATIHTADTMKRLTQNKKHSQKCNYHHNACLV